MSGLGSTLRDARIEKGYTLNTLQQMTKIQKKYLEAIEEGRFEEIPGNFYLRAFVKQFADVVGIDGDELLLEYQAELEAVEHGVTQYDEEVIDTMPSRLNRNQQPTNQTIWDKYAHYFPIVGVGLVFIVVMFFIMMSILNLNKKERETAATSSSLQTSIVTSVEPSAAASASVSQTSSSSMESVEGAVRVGTAQMKLVSGEGEETVYELLSDMSQYQFTVVGKGYEWVGVYEDEEMTMDTTINEGETLKLDIKPTTRSVRIRLGYPEGATIQVNKTDIKNDNQYIQNSILFRVKEGVTRSATTADESQSSASEQQGVTNTTDTNTENNAATNGETTSQDQGSYQGPAVLDPSRRNR